MQEENIKEAFKGATGKEPYDYQERVFREILNLSDSGGLILVEAPTASGKTEAVVFPYLTQHCLKTFPLARRLIYVLPTRALVNAQALRIKGHAEKLGLNLIVNIDHGAVQSPTPMFYGDVVLTTWDAFLYGYAAQRTIGTRLTIPAGNLAVSLIVFDEVQMYQDQDFYTPKLIGSIVNHFKDTGIPLLFMTATLPTRLRGILGLSGTTPISPLDSDAKKPLRGNVAVAIEKEKDILDVIDENRDTIEETIKRQEKVLIVTNTVKKAIDACESARLIEPGAILLHSRLLAKTRRVREKQLIKGRFKVLVATQVVESGLDIPKITFGIVEAAPPDGLIQRIGRIARRKNEQGQVTVVIPRDNGKIHFWPYLPLNEDGLKELENEAKTNDQDTAIHKKLSSLSNFWNNLSEDSLHRALSSLEESRRLLDSFYDQFEEQENGEEKPEKKSKAKRSKEKRKVSSGEN